MVDNHTWKAPQTMSKSLSRIVSWCRSEECGDCPFKRRLRLLLEVHPSFGIVNIRHIDGKHGIDDGPRIFHIISPEFVSKHLTGYSESGDESYQIVRIAWSGACTAEGRWSEPILAILLRPATSSEDLVLVVMNIDEYVGPRITAKYDIKPPREGSTVSDLAITAEGDPMICWLYSQWPLYKFIAYKGERDILDNSQYLVEEIIHRVQPTTTLLDRISSMHVHGDGVFFFPSSMQVPLWKGRQATDQGWKISREVTNLPELHGIWHSEVVGIPLRHYHHHRITHKDLRSGTPTCVNTALKLVVNRKKFDDRNLPLRKGVFILKSVHYPLTCKQHDPYVSNGVSEHIPVACLAEPPDLDHLPTIGMKIALSPRSNRIALAAWRTLRIYSIDPMAFLSSKRSYGSRKSHARRYPHDYAFVNFCGWDYYNGRERVGGCVMLEPVEIVSTGVIYSLDWRSEDELWALTNEGVCRWNIGVRADGRKGVAELGDEGSELQLRR